MCFWWCYSPLSFSIYHQKLTQVSTNNKIISRHLVPNRQFSSFRVRAIEVGNDSSSVSTEWALLCDKRNRKSITASGSVSWPLLCLQSIDWQWWASAPARFVRASSDDALAPRHCLSPHFHNYLSLQVASSRWRRREANKGTPRWHSSTSATCTIMTIRLIVALCATGI